MEIYVEERLLKVCASVEDKNNWIPLMLGVTHQARIISFRS